MATSAACSLTPMGQRLVNCGERRLLCKLRQKKHPELNAFLTEHPDIRQAMVVDPGNFVVPAK